MWYSFFVVSCLNPTALVQASQAWMILSFDQHFKIIAFHFFLFKADKLILVKPFILFLNLTIFQGLLCLQDKVQDPWWPLRHWWFGTNGSLSLIRTNLPSTRFGFLSRRFPNMSHVYHVSCFPLLLSFWILLIFQWRQVKYHYMLPRSELIFYNPDQSTVW